jgi:hypothetical protein
VGFGFGRLGCFLGGFGGLGGFEVFGSVFWCSFGVLFKSCFRCFFEVLLRRLLRCFKVLFKNVFRCLFKILLEGFDRRRGERAGKG